MKKLSPPEKIYLASSRITKAGRGVFAATDIRKGELVERCPVVVIKGKDVPPLKSTVLKSYYFVWHRPMKIAKKVALCLGGHIFSNLMLRDEKVLYTLTKPVEKLAQRVQERIDAEKTFEPQTSKVNKRQKDSFESLCPALLRG